MNLTYCCHYPAGNLSSQGNIWYAGLGEENVEEEEGEEDGTEDAPAEPPVDTELGVQHEVEVPGEGAGPVDPVDGDDLHRGEGEDEDGAPVVVHHLQHHLPTGGDIEQPDTIAWSNKYNQSTKKK